MTVWWLKSTRCNNFIEHYFRTRMKTLENWWCGNVVFKIVFFTLHLSFIPIQIVTWCHHNVWLWNVNQNSNKHSTGIETILKLLLSEKEIGKKNQNLLWWHSIIIIEMWWCYAIWFVSIHELYLLWSTQIR